MVNAGALGCPHAGATKAFGFSIGRTIVLSLLLEETHAGVAKLVDAQDLGSCKETCGGSSPFARTNFYIVRPIENPKKASALFLPIWPEMLRTGPELFSGFQSDVV
jgi:hypothetical protein